MPSKIVLLALLVALCAGVPGSSAFRFMGGEGEGKTDFIGGEMGLLNSVPRMGKRMGNPFDSRFRFRFNNWLANSRMNGNAGFRFAGGEEGGLGGSGGYQLRKRGSPLPPMPSTLVGGAPTAAESVSSVLVGEPGGAVPASLPSSPSGPAGSSMDKLEWYAIADEYWKEYLNDLARKTVIEKMAELDVMDPSGAVPTPLAPFYARNPGKASPVAEKEKPAAEDYPHLLPIVRGNFKKRGGGGRWR